MSEAFLDDLVRLAITVVAQHPVVLGKLPTPLAIIVLLATSLESHWWFNG